MSNFTIVEKTAFVFNQPTLSRRLHEITGQLLDCDSTIEEAEQLLDLVIEVSGLTQQKESEVRQWMAKEAAEILEHQFCTWEKNLAYKLRTRTVKVKKLAEQAPIF